MSFMAPVDTVEEDASDLQFPKAIESENIHDAISATTSTERYVKLVVPDEHTQFKCIDYDAEIFEQKLTQAAVAKENIANNLLIKRCKSCDIILKEPYVKCAVCSNMLLCLSCFASGREIETHLSTHDYVIQRDNVQVFPATHKWTAREERILLRTLETQGYGNWEAVSRALLWTHNAAACKQHYHDCYFGGIFEKLLNLTHARDTYFPETQPYIAKLRCVDPPRHDDITSMQFKMMSGYRVARGDFDMPYDQSAETLITMMKQVEEYPKTDELHEISTLEQKPWTRIEDELKCGIVRAYNHRLRERHRRYEIMRKHGLIVPNRTLSWFSQAAAHLDQEFNWMRFLAFIQICTPISFDMLVQSMNNYTELRNSILRKYELRQNGVRSLAGAKLYFKFKRERALAERQRQTHAFQYDWRKLIPNTEFTQIGPYIIEQPTYIPRKKPGPMKIIGLPGYSKLNEKERQLCSNVRLVPQSYLDHKHILMAENIKLGHLRLADARRLVKIDVNKTRQIYDFLIEEGHIKRPTS